MNNGTGAKLACVGLDCHRNFSSATGRDGSMRVIWRRRLDHKNRSLLREELSSWPSGTPVILEGTFGWGWMSDELKEAGQEPHLSSSTKVAAWRKARGMAKSNKRDADLLSELWGQQPRWWEVWCAGPEVRDLRELLRQRMSLVGMQTSLKNRIHAALHRHGLICEMSDLFGRAGRAWLAGAIGQEATPLRQTGREALKMHLELLDAVRLRIAKLTRQFRSIVRRDPAAKRLMSLPGVSTILGYTILAEVGSIQRFKDSRHLASYSLLAPIADDSGDDHPNEAPIGRRVGRIGRTTLKWAWIEAARSAVRKSPRMRMLFDRYTDGGKYRRNRGYIAVAHQLCVIGYALWKKDQDYQEMPPPRPGSERGPRSVAPAMVQQPNERSDQSPGMQKECGTRAKRRTRKIKDLSRPGTGQPQPAMATQVP